MCCGCSAPGLYVRAWAGVEGAATDILMHMCQYRMLYPACLLAGAQASAARCSPTEGCCKDTPLQVICSEELVSMRLTTWGHITV